MFKIIFLGFFTFSTLSGISRETPVNEVQKILHIGDSQTHGYFGYELYQYLRRHFDEKNLRIFGISGSSPRHWVQNRESSNNQSPCDVKGRYNLDSSTFLRPYLCKGEQSNSFFQNLGKREKEFVIFQFLGNSMGQTQAQIQNSMDLLIAELKGRKCLFITSPPFHEKVDERNIERRKTETKLIFSLKGRCSIFSGMGESYSKQFSKKREYYQNDLIHLSSKGAKAFLKEVKTKLKSLVLR